MKTTRPRRFALGIALAVLPIAASTAPERPGVAPAAPRIWPPPPAAGRIATERSVASPADLGIQPNWLARLTKLFAGAGQGSERLVRPFGVAVDETGGICVTDTGPNVVWYFDGTRHRCVRWDAIGKVRFVQPVAVAKSANLIVVADSGLAQVVAFDEEGHVNFRVGGVFARPAGLALTGTRLYVVDAAAHCVVVCNREGRLLAKFGTRGVGPGAFNFPTHVAVDREGRIFVTDAMNSRIQVFDASHRFLSELGSLGDGSGHFSRPKGVAVDRLGHVYVADAMFDNIQVFDRKGQFLLDLGSSGSGPGEFWMPAGIAIGSDNRIYVADTYNGRVQVLRYIGQP
jgi:DNA-binding beta-propeller fold protein YncE